MYGYFRFKVSTDRIGHVYIARVAVAVFSFLARDAFVERNLCARRCTRRSANGTQPNFAKRKEVNGADASQIRWRCIANVNETIEIRSLVSRGPKNILR